MHGTLKIDFDGQAEKARLLEEEMANLKDGNKLSLSGMFAKVLERDMYEAEVKKARGEIQSTGEVLKKEIKIWKEKYNRELVENDVLTFKLEDHQMQHRRYKQMYLDSQKEVAKGKAEQKYLSKKYIAFLIYKGWAKIRRSAYQTEIDNNSKIIAEQERTIEAN